LSTELVNERRCRSRGPDLCGERALNMPKKKSTKREKVVFEGDLRENIKHIRDHVTPFQDDIASVRQSWFHDLIEWHAKVLFPNLQNTIELVDLVRREIWMVNSGKELNEKSYQPLVKEAGALLRQLEKHHMWLDQNRPVFERIRRISHDLSDSIEVKNSDLESLAKRLRVQQTAEREI